MHSLVENAVEKFWNNFDIYPCIRDFYLFA